MTAAEHLAAAEQLISDAVVDDGITGPHAIKANIDLAIAHGLLAVAIELGVPVTAAAPPAPAGGQQP